MGLRNEAKDSKHSLDSANISIISKNEHKVVYSKTTKNLGYTKTQYLQAAPLLKKSRNFVTTSETLYELH